MGHSQLKFVRDCCVGTFSKRDVACSGAFAYKPDLHPVTQNRYHTQRDPPKQKYRSQKPEPLNARSSGKALLCHRLRERR